MNRVELIGRLTKDPELKVPLVGDLKVCGFTIAVNEGKDKNGDDIVNFINCSVFGKQAENLVKYQRKGALIGLEGKLRVNTYENEKGDKKTYTSVLVERVEYLSNNTTKENTKPEETQHEQIDLYVMDKSKQQIYEPPVSLDIDADELPFY